MPAAAAYTGAGQSKRVFTTSPELTTAGMLPKAWRYIEQDGICLYKGGTTGASNTGREPYSEYYASQIAETMKLNAVHYDFENWKGIIASKCALFTSIDTSFIPVGRIVLAEIFMKHSICQQIDISQPAIFLQVFQVSLSINTNIYFFTCRKRKVRD